MSAAATAKIEVDLYVWRVSW